ncbi:MAG: hypothetical protein ACYC0J_02020, partial [Gammaproteobacteria bacterium]
GEVERTFYDKSGRKRFHLNANGGVTEWRYHAHQAASEEIKYANKMHVNVVKTLTDKTTLNQFINCLVEHPLVNNQQDNKTHFIYDTEGHLKYTINCVWDLEKQALCGKVSEHIYDAASHEVSATQFSAYLPIENGAIIDSSYIESKLTKDPNHDRTYHLVYDSSGRVRFSIDATGAIVEKVYDTFGHLIRQIAYYNRLKNLASLQHIGLVSVASLIQPHTSDRITSWVFNAQGIRTHRVKPEGNVSQYLYDHNGKRTAKIKCVEHADATLAYADLVISLRKLTIHQLDRVNQYSVNSAGQTTVEKDAHGEQDAYGYNIFGKKVFHTDREGVTTKSQFNRLNQEWLKSDPEVLTTTTKLAANGLAISSVAEKKSTQTKFIYDKSGNKIQVISAVGTADERVFHSAYDAYHQISSTLVDNVAIDDVSKVAKLEKRPEKTASIITKLIRNGRGEKIAEQGENEQWTFWIRDNSGKVIYEALPLDTGAATTEYAIGKLNYNAFAEPATKREYALPVHLSAEKIQLYLTSGMPRADLEAVLVESEADKWLAIQYDKNGHAEIVKTTKQLSYLPGQIHPDTQLREAAHVIEAHPETRSHRNAFGEVDTEAVLINPATDTWSISHTRTDKNGNAIAAIDANGYVITAKYNGFNQLDEHIAHAQAIPLAEAASADLDKLLVPHEKDRVTAHHYDNLGQVKRKITKKVSVATLKPGQSNVLTTVSEELKDIEESYQYNKTQDQIAITHEDGHTDYTYYNKKRQIIAKVGLPICNNGETAEILPLEEYARNAHGQIVATSKFKLGAKAATINGYQKVGADAEDQHTLSVCDQRGLGIVEQNGEGHLQQKTYTKSRQLARKYGAHTSKATQPGQPDLSITHIDEHRYTYTAADQVESKQIWRDGQPYRFGTADIDDAGLWTWYKYDGLKHCIGEGPTKANNQVVFRRYQGDQLWSTNEGQGVNQVKLNNLAGKQTLILESSAEEEDKAHDLSLKSYADIQHLLQSAHDDLYERTEFDRDAEGQEIGKTLPIAEMPSNHQVTTVPLQMRVIKRDHRTIVQFKSPGYPVGDILFNVKGQSDSIKKEAVKVDKDYEVDVSDLASDIYQYTVNYRGGMADSLALESTGCLQVITASPLQPHHLVVDVKSDQENCFVYLTGKWDHLDELVLIDADSNQEISHVSVQVNGHGYYLDLSHYPTGRYLLKSSVLSETSLPFHAVTSKPALQPYGKPMLLDLNLKMMNDNQAAFKWTLPDPYKEAQVRVNVAYADAAGDYQTHAVELEASSALPNITFPVNVTAINNVTISVNMGTTEKPDWLLLGSEIAPLDAPESQPATQAGEGVDYAFPSRQLMLFSPWHSRLKPLPLCYLGLSEAGHSRWMKLEPTGASRHGFAVDVTNMDAGEYPLQIGQQESRLVISDNNATDIYAGEHAAPDTKTYVAQPGTFKKLDAWGNSLAVTNTLGFTTNFEYNHRNQETLEIKPLVSVSQQIDAAGSVRQAMLRPTNKSHYNARGVEVATTDARGAVRGKIVEASGREVVTVLADGLHARTSIADALSLEVASLDASRNRTEYAYDRMRQLKKKVSPMGRTREYENNELGHTIKETLSWPNQRAVEHDGRHGEHSHNKTTKPVSYWCSIMPLGITEKRVESDGVNFHQVMVDRNGQPLQEHHQRTKLSWSRDYFGRLFSRVDISGVPHTFRLNQQGLEIEHRTLSGHPGGKMLVLTPYTIQTPRGSIMAYRRTFVPIPAQHIKTAYRHRRPIQITDVTRGQVTYQDHNSEGDVIRTRIVDQRNTVIRDTRSVFDSNRREIETLDPLCRVVKTFDEVDNTRSQVTSLFISGKAAPDKFSESYNLFDLDGRATLSNGVLVNGGLVTYSATQGMLLGYTNGLRTSQNSYQAAVPGRPWLYIAYDLDGLLFKTWGYQDTKRWYDVRCARNEYLNEKGDWYFTDKDDNGWTVNERVYGFNAPLIQETTHKKLDDFGVSHRQETQYQDYNTSWLELNYDTGVDHPELTSVRGQHSRRSAHGDIREVTYFHSPNMGPGGIWGAVASDKGNEYKIATRYMDTTPDNRLLTNIQLESHHRLFGGSYLLGIEQPYFYGSKKQPIAQYTYPESSYSENDPSVVNFVSAGIGISMAGGSALVLLGKGRGEAPNGQLSNASGVREINASYPPPAPSTHTVVQAGETFASLARNYYQDESLAGMIAAHNHQPVDAPIPIMSQVLMPSFAIDSDRADTAMPYHLFAECLRQQLPFLPFPREEEPDNQFWHTVIPI